MRKGSAKNREQTALSISARQASHRGLKTLGIAGGSSTTGRTERTNLTAAQAEPPGYKETRLHRAIGKGKVPHPAGGQIVLGQDRKRVQE
ncbi:hypothetical protein NDU88_001658 [Pleurodeles waltl]|uniref:Uncharacterized protein n=1 Tax=Pleurodeles waltl TaxID=8319 RepID=A0AAV7V8E5_PLEWA|nr:hypothetical protein NDU88_001658 [Pleurodeles waltl]